MKLFTSFLILILMLGCSFDNKSGIWNSESNPKIGKENQVFSDFETLSTKNKTFNKIVPFRGTNHNLSQQVNSKNWTDIFFRNTNNTHNFKYRHNNELIFKSKKITKNLTSDYILLENNNIILSDEKGDIIFYSFDKNKIIYKFNFYQKKFKKISKKINFIVENNIVYVSDNLGYLYSLDYLSKKILWAKNYKIPFRSNLKISENKLIAANQNNILYFFDKKNGEVLNIIPTEETLVKNKFINNILTSKKTTFFLNTYGSLYAVNNQSMKILWFINLNQSNDLNPTNLFLGNQLVKYKDKIIISSNEFTYILNEKSGEIISKKNFSTVIKPVVNNDKIFLITKNNLLISLDTETGKIFYSYNIDELISDFLNIKKKKAQYKNIMIAGDKINIFLNNSYVLKLNSRGEIEEVVKLPSKLKTNPIFSNNYLIYLNKKNKLSIVN